MSQQFPPLEADWIECPLTLNDVESHTVAGTARANWGAVEVTITRPVLGLERRIDQRCWAFAVAASHWPEQYRFALGGRITPKGIERAENLMRDLFLDWLAVSRHEAEIDAACRRAREELAELARNLAARARPLREERSALRRAFKSNELTQQQHQQKRKGPRKRLEELTHIETGAEYAAGIRFREWMNTLCGRKISLHEAERLLTETAFVIWSRSG